MSLLFEIPPAPTLNIQGVVDKFPIHRIFCVGRNYADHVIEMGGVVSKDPPIYFTKSPASFAHSGQILPYPQGTKNYHYEMELVVAIGERGDLFFGAGLDMTRRDLQSHMKKNGNPWDIAKNVENSAIIGDLCRLEELGDRSIKLWQNGALKQSAKISDMIWSVPEILNDLARYYHLRAGDLIFTGTPAGVGPVEIGDRLKGEIDGLSNVELEIGQMV